MSAPLVIAAHGTRDAAGEQVARDLTARVAALLPDIDVSVGFVELCEPSVTEALIAAAARLPEPAPDAVPGGAGRRVVVVPLMLGTGNHVRADIPGFIDEALERFPGVSFDYARHLGPAPALMAAVDRRLEEARGEWSRAETTVVMVGRGAVVPEANADHVRLSRMHQEVGGWKVVEPCFIQVTTPRLPETLERVARDGADKVVVMGHWMFPGRLRTWTREQSQAFAEQHPEVEVRLAEVIGDCEELASVVIERYREMRPDRRLEGSPTYPAGLLLEGRLTVVVGGGTVSSRRVPKLLEAGARVRMVSPKASTSLTHLVETGAIEWVRRSYEEGDLEGAWYVMASTDDPHTNERVAREAEQRHTFCVRVDDAWGGSVWTAATCRVKGATVAVLSNREPKRSRAIRDEINALLQPHDETEVPTQMQA